MTAKASCAPAPSNLAVLEGTRAAADDLAKAIVDAGTRVRHLRWRVDTGALIPAIRETAALEAPGAGDLNGCWGLLPTATISGAAEALQIEQEARGLGLRPALFFPPDHPVDVRELPLIRAFDLAIFSGAKQRDLALQLVSANLRKTAPSPDRLLVSPSLRHVLDELGSGAEPAGDAPAAQRPERIFYFVGLTVTQPFNSGIQRIVRSLGAALTRAGIELIPVKLSGPNAFAPINDEERDSLASWDGPVCTHCDALPDLTGEWLLVPEVSPTDVAGPTVPRLAQSFGMRVASVFVDLIVIKLAHYYDEPTIDWFSRYVVGFADTDVALPISYSVAGDLRRFVARSGRTVPRIAVCPLAGDIGGRPRVTDPRTQPAGNEPFRFLAVGTWEPRKNYSRLLRALALAQTHVTLRDIELTIIGRSADLEDHDREVRDLAEAARGVTLLDHVPDEKLASLLTESHATVYASWEEGFGLPVLESFWYGLPCICHEGSSLVEVATAGGALTTNMLDVPAIAEAIATLVETPGVYARLSREAVSRPIRDWDTYAQDVLLALAGAPRPTRRGRSVAKQIAAPSARDLVRNAIDKILGRKRA